jgi:hypothetical protein
MLKLRKASIVILAQAHNPSIISPDWVKKVLLIKEPPSNFVHTPPFSLFESKSFLLTVDTNRLELVTKVLDNEHISICGQVVGAYFRALPHIPYRSLGQNYIWEYSSNDSSKKPLPHLKLLIDNFDLSRAFNNRNIEYGGTVRVELKPYVLTLKIEYEGSQYIIFNHNFSYAIQTAHKASNILKSFLSLKTRSNEINKSILARGEDNG